MRWNERVKQVLYGGDYNPEQWPEEIWQEDMRLLKEAHINTLTLNVFSWAALQPSEDVYDFTRLDRVMSLVRDHGFKVCLATSTGAHPAWMAKRHPDILRVDFEGRKRKFGDRHNSCPNSRTYRKYAPLLAGKLAEHYRNYDNIICWHVSNEFSSGCWCENCEAAFRTWLQRKYGTLDALNEAWDTAFWSHTFYDWDEIPAPNLLSEYYVYDGRVRTSFQGIALDYRRFMSDSVLECYQLEKDAIRQVTPDIPVTTNMMGLYDGLDYEKWAGAVDVIAWDNYPAPGEEPAKTAMKHDQFRGLKGGKPFLLMEQTPSVTNWQPYGGALKRPGVMRLQSYQAMAHGADSVMFFQMRRSAGASEKLHGAVIDHVGTDQPRVFREVKELGRELDRLGELTLGAESPAQAAILFDWDNRWAIEESAGPSVRLDYTGEVLNYYRAFYERNIPVDVIGTGTALSKYRVVIAPMLYMIKSGFDEAVRRFVADGGTFVTTFFSGIADEHDRIPVGGYPGPLRDVLGIWAEESDALPPGKKNHFQFEGKRYPARILCDLVHTEGADPVAVYEDDFYAGMPAVTVHRFGLGYACYVATSSKPKFYRRLIRRICQEQDIRPVVEPAGKVEATLRINANGRFLYLLNHEEREAAVYAPQDAVDLLTGEHFTAERLVTVPALGVRILFTAAGEITEPGRN